MLRLAVFGDVHGALDSVFEEVKRYEQIRQTKLEAVLQAGDFGVFSFDSPLDKATRKFLKKDPPELGIAPYIAGTSRASKRVFFAASNHEDFKLSSTAGRLTRME